MSENNTTEFPMNTNLVNEIDRLSEERFIVNFIPAFDGEPETFTGDVMSVLGYILPSDQIVSVTRA